jgi:hypothetical protein
VANESAGEHSSLARHVVLTLIVNIRSERCDVLILRPSYFSNPFRIGIHGNRDKVLELYEQYLREHPEIVERAREQLTGRTLGCVCKPKACHGDILIAAMERGEHGRQWKA